MTFIDAKDGYRRYARVRERLPAFDGGRPDDIVDYFATRSCPGVAYTPGAPGWDCRRLGRALAAPTGSASVDAKTDDHFLPLLRIGISWPLRRGAVLPTINAIVLLSLSALVFWRIRYVYPTRTPVLRRLTVTLGTVWAVMVVTMILMLPSVPRGLYIASLFFPVYYTVLSLTLHVQAGRTATSRLESA